MIEFYFIAISEKICLGTGYYVCINIIYILEIVSLMQSNNSIIINEILSLAVLVLIKYDLLTYTGYQYL